MKYFRKQIQGLRNDETINCSWATDRQPQTPCFLRRKRNFDDPEKLKIENIKTLSKAMISNMPNHNKNKVSLKREKEKNTTRVFPNSTQQLPEGKRMEIQFLTHSLERQPVTTPKNINIGLNQKTEMSVSGNRNKNPLQYVNKSKMLNISFNLSNPSRTPAELTHPQVSSPINQLTNISSVFNQEDIPDPVIYINIQSERNSGQPQKQQRFDNIPRMENTLKEMKFNDQKEVPTLVHSKEIEPMSQQLVKTKKNTINGATLGRQLNRVYLKNQAIVNSRLFVSNMNLNPDQDNSNEPMSPSKLKRMEDLVESESVADENDINQSVVVGKFSQFPTIKKLSLEETIAAESLIDKVLIKSEVNSQYLNSSS